MVAAAGSWLWRILASTASGPAERGDGDEVHLLGPEPVGLELLGGAPTTTAFRVGIERGHVEAAAPVARPRPAPLADRVVREPAVPAQRDPCPSTMGPGRNASGTRRRRNPR